MSPPETLASGHDGVIKMALSLLLQASATDFGFFQFKGFSLMVSMPMISWTRDREATSTGNLVNWIDLIITSSETHMP